MKINSTEHYHIYDLQTLGWELTVCNSVTPSQSPCRKIINQNESYGHLLYQYLNHYVSLDRVKHVVEIGGGYGYLMKDFLQNNPGMQVTMIDISPFLLEKQAELLIGHNIAFHQENFLDTDPASLTDIDLAILNENIGDFPTVIDINPDMILKPPDEAAHTSLAEVRRFIFQYDLPVPRYSLFNFNLGAFQAVEKLCSAGVSAVFVSEHSCEAQVPETLQRLVKLTCSGMPERISLRGHDEYTIQFSYLEKIAAKRGYQVIRGPLADFIPLEITDRLKCCLAAPAARTDEDEIIRHFVEDLYKYEYLLLTKQQNTAHYKQALDHRPHTATDGKTVLRLAI